MLEAKKRLTERKAWTMSAFIELRGLSLITMKICSSFSRLMKLPNHDFLASLKGRRQTEITTGFKTLARLVHTSIRLTTCLFGQKLAKHGQKLEPLLFLYVSGLYMDNQNQKYLIDPREKLDSNGITHSGEESGVRLDMSSWVGTVDIKVQSYIGEIWCVCSRYFLHKPLINTDFLLSSRAHKDDAVWLVFPLSIISDYKNITRLLKEIIWSHCGSVQFVWRDCVALSQQLQENDLNQTIKMVNFPLPVMR